MDLLLPCPFCGNSKAPKICDENELATCDCKSDNPYYAVVCIVNELEINTPNWETGCGASGGFAATKKEAVEKWNRRMPSIEDWASALEANKFCEICPYHKDGLCLFYADKEQINMSMACYNAALEWVTRFFQYPKSMMGATEVEVEE